MEELQFNENMILIVPSTEKKQVIESIRKKGLLNLKIMTMGELQKKYDFDYDNQAVFYLMENMQVQYDVAKMYLTHLYEVGEKDFGKEKIRKIINIKNELKQQNLLNFNDYFKEYLKGKMIVLYNCGTLSNLEQNLIKRIANECKILEFHEEKKEYQHECIWEFDTLEEEVSFVASSICKLIQEGVTSEHIKLCGVTGEYPSVIQRIFEWYHLPISFHDRYLYATKIGQDFLEHLNSDATLSLKYIEENYSLKDSNILEIYNEIIKILNQYTWISDLTKIKDFLIEDFKNTKLDFVNYTNEVEVIRSLKEAKENDYVFLLGLNQGSIPETYKDESYFSDSLRELLELDTTNNLNQNSYHEWLENIKHTKNLVITTKKNSPLGVQYLSSLNDDLKLEIRTGTIEYNYSNLYNKIELTKKIDTLVKYNEKSKDLETLFHHYPELNYGTFDSNYHLVDPDKIKEYLNHQLILSYSAMNTYYQCSFRYYLSNILKLNIYEETFYTILGNVFHYILSICFDRPINIRKEYQSYLSKCDYPFNSREKFFLKQLEGDLEFIIETIKKQNETSELKNMLFEEKIEVDKSKENFKILFKGFVDKLMINDEKDIISIIDYKTGNPDLNLNHIIYGLDLQLPVYVYLAKKKFPNARIAGFYLQKILNNEISSDNKHTYEYLKEDKLKLQGYSNSDLEVLEKFDSSYYESKVIKGMRTTSKGLASKKVLNDNQINTLEQITETKIEEAIQGILNGHFDINPKRIGMDNLGCKYCSYKDICFMNEKNIKNLKEYKNMEFLGGSEDDSDETSRCHLD